MGTERRDSSEHRPPGRGEGTLLLAPETNAGTRAYLERLDSTTPPEIDLVVATYDHSPEEWLTAWRTAVGTTPTNLAVVDARGVTRSAAVQPAERLIVGQSTPLSTVAPDDLTALLERFTGYVERWEETGNRTVLCLQSLTRLIDHAGTDAALRYLHLLTHRARATGTLGYFQLDPDAHTRETIDAVAPLFDHVHALAGGDEPRWVTAGGDRDPGSFAGKSDGRPSESRTTEPSDASRSGTSAAPDSRLPWADWLTTLRSIVGRPLTSGAEHDGGGPDGSVDGGDADGGAREDAAPSRLPPTSARIVEVLREHGGRLKQQDLISHTEWSASKVSRALSELEADGRVQKVRVGRENVVVLNDSEGA